ncbi:MAG: PKD domain-containing protein [Bacteroidia bacterium]|nr:PKD domain-containing protein [Bacteroidia bacterium]
MNKIKTLSLLVASLFTAFFISKASPGFDFLDFFNSKVETKETTNKTFGRVAIKEADSLNCYNNLISPADKDSLWYTTCSKDPWYVCIEIIGYQPGFFYYLKVDDPLDPLNDFEQWLSRPDTIIEIPFNSRRKVFVFADTVRSINNVTLLTAPVLTFLNTDRGPITGLDLDITNLCEENEGRFAIDNPISELVLMDRAVVDWGDGAYTYIGDTIPPTIGPRDILIPERPALMDSLVLTHTYFPRRDSNFTCSNSLNFEEYTVTTYTFSECRFIPTVRTRDLSVQYISEPTIATLGTGTCRWDSIYFHVELCPNLGSNPSVIVRPNILNPNFSQDIAFEYSNGRRDFSFSLEDINHDSTGSAIIPPGYYTCEIEVVGNCGSLFRSIDYRITAPLSATLTSDKVRGCYSLEIELSNESSGSIRSANYNFGDGVSLVDSVLTDTVISYVYDSAGVYLVNLEVEDSLGCTDNRILEITVLDFPQPVADFETESGKVCVGDKPLMIPDSISPLLDYDWDFGNGVTAKFPSPPFTDLNPNLPNEDSVYWVTLTVSSKEFPECKDEITKPVRFFRKPENGLFPRDTAKCIPFTLAFGNTDSANYAYSWSINSSELVNEQNFSRDFMEAGTSSVEVLVDNNGCSILDSIVILAEDVPVTTISTLTPVLCNLDKGRFNFDFETSDDYTHLMDYGDGTVKDSGVRSFHIFEEYGEYWVTLTTTNKAGCSYTDSLLVIYRPEIEVDFDYSNDNCPLYELKFLSQAPVGLNYEWSFGDGKPIIKDENPTYSYQSAGIFEVKLEVSTNAGCRGFISKMVEVLQPLEPDFSFKAFSVINQTGEVRVEFTNSTLPNRYSSSHWDFGDGGSSEDKHPTYTYDLRTSGTAEFNVTLTVVDSINGCEATYLGEVNLGNLCATIYVPTGFAPGRTVPYQLKGCGLATMNFTIRDPRNDGYGKIWQTSRIEGGQPTESWDGTVAGGSKMVTPGVYKYLLEVSFQDGQRYTEEGNVTIL